MKAALIFLTIGVTAAMTAGPGRLFAAELVLPEAVTTVADGRADIRVLYSTFAGLVDDGWTLDIVTESQPAGTAYGLPVVALRSPQRGPATWIISGIHGEEPAGPNAIAAAIDVIAAHGARHPVVLLPLNNPHGYVRNWRYLNTRLWSEDIEAQSVGDSSHLLPDPADPGMARSRAASSAEADAIGRYIIATMVDYPPVVSIDLHEDNLLDAGYVYSQGADGASDSLAREAVRVLAASGVPIQPDGTTRFDEPIEQGIVGPVADSSIDELMSALEIVVDGETRPGPAARSVLVFETPARELPLERRSNAHKALLWRMLQLISEP